MQIENVIAVGILVIGIAIILGIRLYKFKKQGKTLKDFIDLYGDRVIEVLKDSIRILSIKPENYDTKEDYEKAIIENSLEYIKTNYQSLDIDVGLLGFTIDNDLLTDILYEFLHANYKEAFSVLSDEIIKNNSNLIDASALE